MSISRQEITFLGDSTLDNKIWVDGLISSWIATRFGVKRDEASVRVEKFNNNIIKPSLSVIENVMQLMPEYCIHDFTNDGFTTRDVLSGNFRDKVFPTNAFSSFPNKYFRPLVASKEHIKKSEYIVLSVGGNNFRELLLEAKEKKNEDREQFIKEKFDSVFNDLTKDYIYIIEKIRELNPNACIILLTQYYPSTQQKNYQIYEFMQEIGKIMGIGGSSNDPMTVIHTIVQMTYTKAFKQLSENKIDNIVVADITSSLNPHDNSNHVSQIEPSAEGGKKIAMMLKYLMTDHSVIPGNTYRFLPDFFRSAVESNTVKTSINEWIPFHPNAFKTLEMTNADEILLISLYELNEENKKNQKTSHQLFKFINKKDRFEDLIDKIKSVVEIYQNPLSTIEMKKQSLDECINTLENKGLFSIYAMDTLGYQTTYQTKVDRLLSLLENKSSDEQARIFMNLYSYYCLYEKKIKSVPPIKGIDRP